MAKSNVAVSDREAVYSSMSENVRTWADSGQKKITASEKAGTLAYYDLGKIVQKVYATAAFSEEDKLREVGYLAKYWDYTPSRLQEFKNVVETFSEEFIVEQLKLPLPNGKTMTWNHFLQLQKVKTQARRDALLKKTREKSWSAKDLATELQARGAASNIRRGGRKPQIPHSPAAMLHKAVTTAKGLENYLNSLYAPLRDTVQLLESDKIDGKLMSKIDEAAGALLSAEVEVANAIRELRALQERTLALRKEAMEAAAAAEATSDSKELVGAD